MILLTAAHPRHLFTVCSPEINKKAQAAFSTYSLLQRAKRKLSPPEETRNVPGDITATMTRKERRSRQIEAGEDEGDLRKRGTTGMVQHTIILRLPPLSLTTTQMVEHLKLVLVT